MSRTGLTFQCIPSRDPLGLAYGDEYQPACEAGIHSTYSTDTLFFSTKNNRRVDSLGTGERAMMFLLEISPFVLAYRTQYPVLLPQAVEKLDEYLCGLTNRIPVFKNSDILSIDIMVTARHGLSTRWQDKFDHYYIFLSHKMANVMRLQRTRRRISRERAIADYNNFEYKVFSRSENLDICARSAKQIIVWAEGLNIDAASENARRLSALFYQSYEGELLGRFLRWAARKLTLTFDDALQHFSAAIYCGNLFVDLSQRVAETSPVRLIDRSEAVPPWISPCGKVNCCSEK
jgi:hypothetical protein